MSAYLPGGDKRYNYSDTLMLAVFGNTDPFVAGFTLQLYGGAYDPTFIAAPTTICTISSPGGGRFTGKFGSLYQGTVSGGVFSSLGYAFGHQNNFDSADTNDDSATGGIDQSFLPTGTQTVAGTPTWGKLSWTRSGQTYYAVGKVVDINDPTVDPSTAAFQIECVGGYNTNTVGSTLRLWSALFSAEPEMPQTLTTVGKRTFLPFLQMQGSYGITERIQKVNSLQGGQGSIGLIGSQTIVFREPSTTSGGVTVSGTAPGQDNDLTTSGGVIVAGSATLTTQRPNIDMSGGVTVSGAATLNYRATITTSGGVIVSGTGAGGGNTITGEGGVTVGGESPGEKFNVEPSGVRFRLPFLDGQIIPGNGIALPKFVVAGQLTPGSGVVFPTPIVSGDLGEAVIGAVTFKPAKVAGRLRPTAVGDGEVTFSALSVDGSGGVQSGQIEFQKPVVAGELTIPNIGTGGVAFSLAQVDGDSPLIAGAGGVVFAALQIAGEAEWNYAAGGVAFRSLSVAGAAVAGAAIDGGVSFSTFIIDGAGYTTYTATGAVSFSLPEVYGVLQTVGLAATTYAINPRIQAVTEYTNFAFNSYAAVGGRYFAASENGLFALGGDEDLTAAIDARIKTRDTTFGSPQRKRCTRAYVRGVFAGDMQVSTYAEGLERAYYANIQSAQRQSKRVQLGRAVDATYWAIALENVAGADFTLDDITLDPELIQRRF